MTDEFKFDTSQITTLDEQEQFRRLNAMGTSGYTSREVV